MFNRDNRGSALTRRPQEGLSRPRTSDWLWQRDPWQEMQEMQNRMDHLISHVFGERWPAFSPPMGQMMNQMSDLVAEPDIDFSESETEYSIRAALPGISPNDIEVQATEDSIRLTAQTRASTPQQGSEGSSGGDGAQAAPGSTGSQQGQTTQHRQSQFSRVSRFEFAYTLPEEIKPNDVSASFRNGVLELRLPKAQTNPSRNRMVTIPIQGADQTAQISGGAQTAPGDRAQQSAQTTGERGGAEHEAGGRSGNGAGATPQAGQANKSRASAGAAAAKSK